MGPHSVNQDLLEDWVSYTESVYHKRKEPSHDKLLAILEAL